MEERIEKKARLIAYYLPQYHPIPENDEWWGKGFTEWTNTAKARPLFWRHYQPHIPADLGFYDLRLPETRSQQAAMAKKYGLEGFCYYHYWFAGRQLLERPFREVLETKLPDFPFCLCWANETWEGRWHGNPRRTLIEQTYPGPKDWERHFYALLPAFKDRRYITVSGRPIFLIYKPAELWEGEKFIENWRWLAKKEGLEDIYFIGAIEMPWSPEEHGFDAVTPKVNFHAAAMGEMKYFRKIKRLIRRLMRHPENIYSYKKIMKHLLVHEAYLENVHPCIIPNWDNTPRCARNGVVLHKSRPDLFEVHLQAAMRQVDHKPEDKKLIFVKSWNEWAEGNHLEPDLKYGLNYLEVIKKNCVNLVL
jgi:hypothetical protein